jgi:hypothetical protein
MRRRAVKGVDEKRRRRWVPRGGGWWARVVSECVSQAYATGKRCFLVQWPWQTGPGRFASVVSFATAAVCIRVFLVGGPVLSAQGLGRISTTPQCMSGIAGTTEAVQQNYGMLVYDGIWQDSSNDRGVRIQ